MEGRFNYENDSLTLVFENSDYLQSIYTISFVDIVKACEKVDELADVKRRLAHALGVIEALQANIADLTSAVPPVPPPVGSLAHLVMEGEAKPAISAQALQPAKLPRFF